MKRIQTGIAALVFAASFTAVQAQDLSGRDIAQRVHDANKSAVGLVLKGAMSLKNLKNNSTENRAVMALSVRQGGLSKSLFRFTDSTYSGTTFLTIERRGSDNLQYLFLKSVGSPRQIEGSDREKSFVDTDLSHEDLGGSQVDDYNYNRLANVKADGRDCYVIERMPKRRNSNFSKHAREHEIVRKVGEARKDDALVRSQADRAEPLCSHAHGGHRHGEPPPDGVPGESGAGEEHQPGLLQQKPPRSEMGGAVRRDYVQQGMERNNRLCGGVRGVSGRGPAPRRNQRGGECRGAQPVRRA
jgi:hypothetical protein